MTRKAPESDFQKKGSLFPMSFNTATAQLTRVQPFHFH